MRQRPRTFFRTTKLKICEMLGNILEISLTSCLYFLKDGMGSRTGYIVQGCKAKRRSEKVVKSWLGSRESAGTPQSTALSSQQWHLAAVVMGSQTLQSPSV